MKILIYGAGSIGNHYANGFIERGHEVFVTDISEEALLRMKTDIYPSRYKHWNDSIKLINSSQSDELFVDVVIIVVKSVDTVFHTLSLIAVKSNCKSIDVVFSHLNIQCDWVEIGICYNNILVGLTNEWCSIWIVRRGTRW